LAPALTLYSADFSVQRCSKSACRSMIEAPVTPSIERVLDQRAGEEAQQGSRRRHDDLPKLPALPEWLLHAVTSPSAFRLTGSKRIASRAGCSETLSAGPL